MSLTFHFKWILVFFLLASCSTVKKMVIKHRLKEAQDKKSEQVTYSPPPAPFKQQENEQLDAFWWNEETLNSISYFSSCPKGNIQISLKEIEKGVLLELTNSKVIKSLERKNTRYTEVRTPTNESEIRTGIYIIKAPKCFYILNFVASSPKNFKKDEPIFKQFISNFKGQ